MKLFLSLFTLISCLPLFSQSTRILHYTETTGYNHGTKSVSYDMFDDMGQTHGWTVTDDDDGDMFSSLDSLQKFAVVVFSNTSGDNGLNATQRANFEAYIASGGSYLGIHAASDTYRHSSANGGSTGSWDWYAEQVAGASVQQNPNHTSSNHVDTIYHLIPGHPISQNLPDPWVKQEEYYYWEDGYLAPGFTDVLQVGETGSNSQDDPRTVARFRTFLGGGKSFYTSLGHSGNNFQTGTQFYQLIEDAMLWILSGNGGEESLVQSPGTSHLHGEMKTWHKIRLDLGADTTYSETGTVNPFLDRKLDVTFTGPSGQQYVVPGYFAGDGEADSSGTSEGNVWSVYLRPDEAGTWTWSASFLAGNAVAIDTTGTQGSGLAPIDGLTGSFAVSPTDKSLPDLRARGRLEYVGERYRKFAGSEDDYFIKVGPDSPENLLGYADFDNTVDDGGTGGGANNLQGTGTYQDALGDTYNWPGDGLHRYAPHVNDWNTGDPVWGSDQGKGIIGAINYLASEGLNSISMLLNNLDGDGQEVYPFVNPNTQSGEQEDRKRYDVSKLAQWGIVMDYAEEMGFHLHFKLQETENLDLMTDQELWLYYREMTARFGHHLAITWNLGEENDLPIIEIEDRALMLRAFNPWPGQHVVVHTFPYQVDQVYSSLLGSSVISGMSLQDGYVDAHDVLVEYDTLSAESGKQWVVCYDEVNSAWHGVTPDAGYPGSWTSNPPNQTTLRENALAGALMAGAEGMESYFGYDLPMSDLDAEDFRSRDQWWDYCRWAKEAVEMVPFWTMDRMPEFTTDPGDEWVLSNGSSAWLYYSQDGGDIDYDLPAGQYEVQVLNMATGNLSPANTFSTGAGYTIGAGTGDDFFAVVTAVSPFDGRYLRVSEYKGKVCWDAPDETTSIQVQRLSEGAWETMYESTDLENCWVNRDCQPAVIRVVANQAAGAPNISDSYPTASSPEVRVLQDRILIDCIEEDSYVLSDLMGRTIRTGQIGPDGISTSGLLSGYYFVRIGERTFRIQK